ncbi:MAG: hypothetical protein JNM17_02825 [Archangium sp.]|nr:hypothetical protein [Archangium sp.]
MKRALLVVLLFSACAEQEQTEASFWRVRDMWKPKNELADFGGWKPRQLLATVGTPLFFEENAASQTVLNDGLVVQPGVSNGTSAPFVITEIWRNHPTTWIQPVWVPRKLDGNAPPKGLNVFSVNDDSTFYSPFWQLEVVVNDELKDDNEGFRSAREVLAVMGDEAKTTLVDGPLVYCPIIPDGVYVARNSAGVHDPVTGGTLDGLEQLTRNEAWAENAQLFYGGFGAGRFTANGQLPVASRAYFWVTSEGEPVLPLAAVLPAQPKAKSFVTRVDMRIPPTAGVYVPSSRPDLREKLLNLGLRVPAPSPANANVDARALQVMLNPDCVTDAGISSCTFVDSEAAVFSSGVWTNEQPVQLAIGVVGP